MGLYRLCLALAVLVSHTKFQPGSVNIGASAVVSFFILSGYVMTLLVDRRYAAPGRAAAFYLDRVGRIFPQYLVYLTLTVALVSSHAIVFGFVAGCGPIDAMLNAAALPLGWARAIGLDCQYLPQAWSLGLELTFYLVVPSLIFRPRVARVAAISCPPACSSRRSSTWSIPRPSPIAPFRAPCSCSWSGCRWRGAMS